MRGGNRTTRGFCALLVALAIAGPLQAQDAGMRAGFGELGKPVDRAVLDAKRGRQQVVINAMETDAKLHDNRAVDTVSGSNYISDSAFSSSSGLPTAIQNSGNNVIIQNSFILNVDLQ